MSAEWLLHWWNLIFLLPFGLALLYLGLYTLMDIDQRLHGLQRQHQTLAQCRRLRKPDE